MTEEAYRTEQLFYEVFESLPRQGPGNRASTARALALCGDVGPAPSILDLGCGSGAQTLDLADLTEGSIVAVDLHAPNVERLRERVESSGLSSRVQAEVGDFGALRYASGSFDIVWSEGALYNLGLERALGVCRGLLRPGGRLAFTDAVWRTDDPPEEVRAIFREDYPAMGRVPDDLAAIERAGFEMLDYFTLPDEAWWDDFYTPMRQRIAELREYYREDSEALGVLAEITVEPDFHAAHGHHYAYEFFVCRRRD